MKRQTKKAISNSLKTQEISKNWELNNPKDVYNRVANWCLLGFENEVVKLKKADQLRIFGFYAGKGSLAVECVNGIWTVKNIVKVCFGTDTAYNGVFNLHTGQRIS